jgi:YihY family inner membrane protein
MFKWLYGSILYSKADRLGTYAAALAYCVVLSLVPFLAVTFVVGSNLSDYLALTKHYDQNYAQVLSDILPTQDSSDTKQIFAAIKKSYDSPQKSGFFTIGFLLALYTSFNLMDQIGRTLLFIFDDPRKPQEWGWKIVAKTFMLLLIWMCLLLLISISAVEASFLRHLLDKSGLSVLSQVLATTIQVLVVICALFGTFYLTYQLIPAKNYSKNLVVEGSLVASTGWIACSLIFASIVPSLLKTSAAYVALGSVVAILLWAQACAWSIIVGACWIVRFSAKK